MSYAKAPLLICPEHTAGTKLSNMCKGHWPKGQVEDAVWNTYCFMHFERDWQRWFNRAIEEERPIVTTWRNPFQALASHYNRGRDTSHVLQSWIDWQSIKPKAYVMDFFSSDRQKRLEGLRVYLRQDFQEDWRKDNMSADISGKKAALLRGEHPYDVFPEESKEVLDELATFTRD